MDAQRFSCWVLGDVGREHSLHDREWFMKFERGLMARSPLERASISWWMWMQTETPGPKWPKYPKYPKYPKWPKTPSKMVQISHFTSKEAQIEAPLPRSWFFETSLLQRAKPRVRRSMSYHHEDYPLVIEHSHGKTLLILAKSAVNGDFP